MFKLLRIFLAGTCLWAGGCATVYAPSSPARPTTVFLTNYGVHSSLILPNGDGRFVEYSYGDWHYATTVHDWPWNGIAACFFSCSSGLGRRYLPADSKGLPVIPAHTTPHLIEWTPVQVNGPAVERLVGHLNTRYAADRAPAIVNPENNNVYVIDDEHYSIFNNCNALTASCLRSLDCRVVGLTIISGFVVVPAHATSGKSHH